MKATNVVTMKRFVIRKSLIGQGLTITFTNKKGQTWVYNHDDVYNTHKDKFDAMECFAKYKSYTNTNVVPAFARACESVEVK
jgi:hypothetical protein